MTATTLNMPWPEDWPDDFRHAAEQGHCLHCGNPLGKFWRPEDGPFCCRGCAGVHQLIHQENLDRYYDLKPATTAPAADLRHDSFGWLDRLLAERDTYTGAHTGPLRLDLDIQGVHCAACVWLIEELFRRRDAGIQIRINPTLGKVELVWDQERGDLKEFLAEVEQFGYRLGPSTRGVRRQSHALLLRMAIAISMALNVMMFSLSFYFGLAEGNLYHFFGWLSLVMATVSLLAGGGVFLKGAVAGLRRGVLHLDVPISLGMILAYAGSVYAFLTAGPDHAYFDSLTIFIALMLIGRWAQEHILERNRNSLLDTSGAENLTVKRKLPDGDLEAVAAPRICKGDELWIAPGDLLPVEGMLMRRVTSVSLDWITGESDQVAFRPGDRIPAGAFNASENGFSATALEDFATSRLQDLLSASTVSDEEFRPRWWHKVSSWYVSVVLAAAVAGFLVWLPQDPTRALKVTIAVLVVTCPCALGLATPLAEELIHAALRRVGVFLRKPSFLEKALRVRKILLDKTGTLTLDRLTLDEDSREELDRLDPPERRILRHMTSRSNHPVSVCLARALAGSADPLPADFSATAAEELREVTGAGLELVLDGVTWRLGLPAFALTESAGRKLDSTTVVFSSDGVARAVFTLQEDLKKDAPSEVARLRGAGYEVYLLSGDRQAKVDQVAAALGIEPAYAVGELTPEAKAAKVRQLDDHDTLMVGDGLNDSPSFAAALCAATPAVDRPVLPGKADFYFLGDGIGALGKSLAAARVLRRVVRDNLILAVLYNLGAVGLCLAGLVTPVVAAIIMPVSSVTVVTLTAVRLADGRLSWTS